MTTRFLLLCVLATGCQQASAPPPPANVASAPLLASATQTRLQTIGANAEAAELAAGHIAEPFTQAAVLGPVSVIRSLAPGPYPEPLRLAALALVNQALAGKLDAASAGWTTSRAEADENAQRITALEAKVAAERIAAGQELTRQLAAERARANSVISAKQVLYLNLAGAGCLVTFGLFVGFGGLPGVLKGYPLGILALLCFGLAQIVGAWWFKLAALTVLAAGLGVVAWWIYEQMKAGKLAAAAQAQAIKFKTVLNEIVPVLDVAYETADSTGKATLDRTVFDPLASTMDRAEKATVHEVRATALTPPAGVTKATA